jgi:CheY-like chemotaxis protein
MNDTPLPPRAAPVPAGVASPPGTSVDLLLVDDSPTDAELCLRALTASHLGNSVTWVQDGEQALDFMFGRGKFIGRSVEHPPKVVLLDLRLPKVDGLEVLRQIRSDDRLKTVPVVVLSSSTQDRDVLESYRLGANGYVNKPVEFQQFSEVVAKLGLYWLLVNKPPY